MAVVKVPNTLREWRVRHDWTLADVHGLTGVSISHLSLIERGLREPHPQLKVRIARGVGASVAELFPPPEAVSA
jgi:transcriptional regulator with XRE-family HTH domain